MNKSQAGEELRDHVGLSVGEMETKEKGDQNQGMLTFHLEHYGQREQTSFQAAAIVTSHSSSAVQWRGPRGCYSQQSLPGQGALCTSWLFHLCPVFPSLCLSSAYPASSPTERGWAALGAGSFYPGLGHSRSQPAPSCPPQSYMCCRAESCVLQYKKQGLYGTYCVASEKTLDISEPLFLICE